MESRPMDVSSMRRVGEALLLAQNRARISTERANRSERLLRTVLSQANLRNVAALERELNDHQRSYSFGMLQQWEDMPETSLSTAVAPNYDEMANRQLATMFYTEPRVVATDHPTRLSPSGAPCDPMIAQMAKEIIANLEAAAVRAESRVRKYHNQPCRERSSSLKPIKNVSWFELWKYRIEVSSFLSPMQFMAGLVVGVALGVAFAKRMALHHERIQQNALAKSLYRCTSDTGSNEVAASRRFSGHVPFSMDDMSYLLHHPAIDVS